MTILEEIKMREKEAEEKYVYLARQIIADIKHCTGGIKCKNAVI